MEICYEGNYSLRWGDLKAEEFIHRCIQCIIAGTYPGHGEVLETPELTVDEIWTGIGVELRGESSKRMKFLRKLIEDGPSCGLEPIDRWWRSNVAGKKGEYFLVYLGEECSKEWKVEIPIQDSMIEENSRFKIDIVDPWNMTIEKVLGEFELVEKTEDYVFLDKNDKIIELFEKPYTIIRLRKIG